MKDEEEAAKSDRGRIVAALGCVLVVLLIASFLPLLQFEAPVGAEESGPTQDSELLDGTGGDEREKLESDSSNDGDGSFGGPPRAPENLPLVDGQTQYHIESNRSLVPGTVVRLWVGDDAASIEDVAVVANGRQIGRTDQYGHVIAEVPYTNWFNISAQKPKYRDSPVASLSENETIDWSVDLPTQIDLASTRRPRPHEAFQFTAHIDGVRVADAAVLANGERIGETGANGRYSVRIPQRDATNLTVVRGAATGGRTVSVAPLQMTLRTEPFAQPMAGQPVTVVVTQDGQPVDGATVELDGAEVGTTGASGTRTVTLPWASKANLSVSAGEQATARSVQNLYSWYTAKATVVGGVLLVLVLLCVTAIQFVRSPVSRSFVSMAVRILVDIVAGTVDRVLTFVGWVVETLARVRAAYTPTPAGIWAALLAAISAVRTAVAGLLFRTRQRVEHTTRAVTGFRRDTDEAVSTAAPVDTDDDDEVDIRDAWAELVRPIVRRPESRPPRELASAAVQYGAPRNAAHRLADAFRDVMYGQANPDDHTAAARESIAAVRAARTADEPAVTETDPEDENDA